MQEWGHRNSWACGLVGPSGGVPGMGASTWNRRPAKLWPVNPGRRTRARTVNDAAGRHR
ncbi:hypothetical protein FM114_03685 [Luteococcus japonicus LSP_Lj1]|uniref:Uncharacterized protein n=1 Tax=Luteococcus japonicus LSP_Lj1 TaxID=1255658 RepID=A0A1R4ITZ2_9ACTN|nr:hypothetical protein FM114_03685 [Luteococcus japonicus LSP_Lj1]